jgi:5-methylcytosine-specific restriction protein B
MSDLRAAFRDKILPLLQEYFFDDYSRIQMVVSNASGKSRFIRERELGAAALFGPGAQAESNRKSYEITSAEQWTVDDFKSIYEPA